ncbi:hypothetical protein T492DRAFT_865241 [Pavlovales sp. CCMP2436]|nr:hypothetical protein T492DRAFT_865241 [Pavlovales sp. CCMP2436]
MLAFGPFRFVANDVGCAGSEATLNACSFTTPVSNCGNGEMPRADARGARTAWEPPSTAHWWEARTKLTRRTLRARLILARARSLHTQTARAAAGARGAPWFQRTGRSANGPEDASAHADGAYRDDNWRSHNANRGARLGRGDRGGRGGQGTRT